MCINNIFNQSNGLDKGTFESGITASFVMVQQLLNRSLFISNSVEPKRCEAFPTCKMQRKLARFQENEFIFPTLNWPLLLLIRLLAKRKP